MKKITVTLVVLAALAFSLCANCLANDALRATEETPTAYVNIYDGQNVVAAMEEVPYKDEDNDGKWTVNDLLLTIHESKCKDGYATANGDYGLFITKLWNVENGGSYGFYVNDQMSMGVTDEIKGGDTLYAYVYSDVSGFSDAYSFFDQKLVSGQGGNEITLTLSYVSGFDENYAPVISALEGAGITVNGKDINTQTDAEGKVKLTLPEDYAVISAHKDGVVLVPPVFVSAPAADTSAVTDAATDAEPAVTTSDAATTAGTDTAPADKEGKKSSFWLWFFLIVALVAVACVCVIIVGNKKNKK